MGPALDGRADNGDDGGGDLVFRALADPGRRALVDALHDRDAQSLGDLCHVLPSLTRFGVMKHLAVLAEANLVSTEKVGRVKYHYLNPVPIRQIHDQWIAKYAVAPTSALVDLAANLEGRATNTRS